MKLIAENLGISPRTLQRRLGDEGRSFDDIREGVRRARALELVGKNRVPIAEVAAQLGFSDTRAFRRAFRRWTGTVPCEVARARHAAKTKPLRRQARGGG